MMEWERRLDKSILFLIIHMPYFGFIEEFNVRIKQFMVCFHGGYLWIDHKILVDIKLIVSIIGIPLVDFDPTPFFTGKDQDIELKNKMKEKYELMRDKRGFSIASINDIIFRFTIKELSIKLL